MISFGAFEPSEEERYDAASAHYMAQLRRSLESGDRASPPTSWDSRDKGWVTPVKYQGSCGSCAAFATASVIETCLLKAGDQNAEDISEQYLLDCGYDGS